MGRQTIEGESPVYEDILVLVGSGVGRDRRNPV